jgi:hypothetical protein
MVNDLGVNVMLTRHLGDAASGVNLGQQVLLELTVCLAAFCTLPTGRIWQKLNLPETSSKIAQVLSVFFTTPIDGWAATTVGLFATTNNGKTWRRLSNEELKRLGPLIDGSHPTLGGQTSLWRSGLLYTRLSIN